VAALLIEPQAQIQIEGVRAPKGDSSKTKRPAHRKGHPKVATRAQAPTGGVTNLSLEPRGRRSP